MRYFLFLLLILFGARTTAQLYITPGAQLTLTGNAQLTLENMHFTNNGLFEAGTSRVSFQGLQTVSINGSVSTQFYDLHINKINDGVVVLNYDAGVSHHVIFSNGRLSVSNYVLDLGTTGLLQGESETSRIEGSSGQVRAARMLNAPLDANPGNLGAIISSSQNLGLVRVHRGHEGQFVHGGINAPVYRYYQIIPAQNIGLNASLNFSYLEAELNGNTENSLSLFQRTAPSAWANRGFSSRNAAANTIAQTGLDSLSLFTVSAAGGALPVHFSLFNARCNSGGVVLTWHTATEQGSHRFAVQRSSDGRQWTEIGSVAAAGNSNTQRMYTFTDNVTLANAYYRLAEYDVNGRVQYSGVLRSSCNAANKFLLWPNPTHGQVYVNLIAAGASTAVMRVYDSKGSLLKEKRAAVLPGNNQLTIDLTSLPAGMYTLIIQNNEDRNTTTIYKQ